jgi:hypothetical protein
MESTFFYYWIGSIVVGLAGFFFLRFSKNARLKRVVFPSMLIISFVLVICFAWSTFAEFGAVFYVFVVMGIGISYLNYRKVVFCESCAAMTTGEKFFSRPTECSACGSKWV